MMADYNAGNHAVEANNEIAAGIMGNRSIPTVDLYGVVTRHCGTQYVDCDICAKEPCAYHYKPEGYALIAKAVSTAITDILHADE